MHAINFLASLLAKENGIIRAQTIIKCLQFTLKYYEGSLEMSKMERVSSENFTTEVSEAETMHATNMS